MTQGNVPSGIIVLIVGPSGVGKGALIEKAMQALPGFVLSVSATTRKRRPDEHDGVNYHFMNRDDFLKKKAAGGFIETALYSGELYGTPYSWLREQLAAGRNVFVEIETQGAQKVMGTMPDQVLSIFILPPEPQKQKLRERLEGRQKKSGKLVDIDERLRIAEEKEIPLANLFNHQVVNDVLEDAAQEVIGHICARLRKARAA